MVTGVPNPQPLGSRPTPPNGTPRSDTSIPQQTDVMTEIHHVRSIMGETLTQPKILQTQVPLFKGNRDKYYEFEHLLLNHLRPHAHKLTEEQKLNLFQSLLRDDAIEFWQTLTITTETTLKDILAAFKKVYAKEELSEVSKFKFHQLRYDPTTESFSTFLANYKNVAKQVYGEKAQEVVQTFLLPNYQSSSKTNWQLQANTTPALRIKNLRTEEIPIRPVTTELTTPPTNQPSHPTTRSPNQTSRSKTKRD